MAAVDEMTYEQARDELVSVVGRLEAGDETLEGSLALWERGEALAARCQQWLDGARARLDAARSGTAQPAPAPDPPPPERARPAQGQPEQGQPAPGQPAPGQGADDDVDRADDTEDKDA